jgi:hypothetical protein
MVVEKQHPHLVFPEGPILGTLLHPLEHDCHDCWSNRRADLTGYRNQFFAKSDIDSAT